MRTKRLLVQPSLDHTDPIKHIQSPRTNKTHLETQYNAFRDPIKQIYSPVKHISMNPSNKFRADGARSPSRVVVKLVQALGGVPREQNMLKGHLPRVIYHHGY